MKVIDNSSGAVYNGTAGNFPACLLLKRGLKADLVIGSPANRIATYSIKPPSTVDFDEWIEHFVLCYPLDTVLSDLFDRCGISFEQVLLDMKRHIEAHNLIDGGALHSFMRGLDRSVLFSANRVWNLIDKGERIKALVVEIEGFPLIIEAETTGSDLLTLDIAGYAEYHFSLGSFVNAAQWLDEYVRPTDKGAAHTSFVIETVLSKCGLTVKDVLSDVLMGIAEKLTVGREYRITFGSGEEEEFVYDDADDVLQCMEYLTDNNDISCLSVEYSEVDQDE